MFAEVTCRPDTIFPTMLLIQNKTSPAECHHANAKKMFRHLRSTIDDGLYFWNPIANHKLPDAPFPTLCKETHNTNTPDSS